MSNQTFGDFRDASTAYLTKNNYRQKKPVFFVKFGLVTGPLGTNSQVLPDEYCTGTIQNATKSRKRLMGVPSKSATQINVVTSETTISSATFRIMNLNGEGTRIVTNYIMKNRLVTIYRGFADIDEQYYAVFYQGQIDNWTKASDATYYEFTVVDAKKQLKQSILGGHSQLTVNLNTTDTTAYVNSTDGFASATDLGDGQGQRNYLRIKDSLYSYTSITPLTFEGLQLVQLNSNGTPTAELQQNGENVDNYVLYQGNPITIMLQIILSTGTGTNWSGTGTNYDVLPASQGIGVPYTLVNITNFESQRGIYIADFYFSQFFIDQIEALKFIQREILRQINAYLFVNQSGLLDIKMYYVPVGTLDAIELNNDNIVGTPLFDANLQTGNAFYNEIDVSFDYQPIPDFFATEQLTEDLASQQKYEELASLAVESKFIRTYYNGFNIADRISNIMIARYGNPPPVITVKTFYTNNLLNPGDPVYISCSVIPNYVTGKDGDGPILCEVTSIAEDASTSTVTLTLLGIGFNVTARQAPIGPNSLGSYSSSNDTLRRSWAFISNNSGLMPDSTPAYLITP